MGSYKPFPQHYSTFGYTAKLVDDNKKNNNSSKVAYLGKEERFKDPKKSKG